MLPRIKQRSTQTLLFLPEKPLTGHGSVRTQIGSLGEELCELLLGAERFQTDGRCKYCPDLRLGPYYIENKVVGKNSTCMVYKGRLEKDRIFARDHALLYVIWHHRAETKLAANSLHLRSLFYTHLRNLRVVPFEEIDAICSTLSPVPLNSKYGKGKQSPNSVRTYGEGYRFALSHLDPFINLEFDPCIATEGNGLVTKKSSRRSPRDSTGQTLPTASSTAGSPCNPCGSDASDAPRNTSPSSSTVEEKPFTLSAAGLSGW